MLNLSLFVYFYQIILIFVQSELRLEIYSNEIYVQEKLSIKILVYIYYYILPFKY
jgi:hypothetical protein